MLRKSLAVAIAAAFAALLTPAKAHAWGAAHIGYTHVGPAGIYHVGRTAAVGPYGAYGGYRAGAYGYGGAAYRTGYGVGYGGAYGYNAGYGGAYHYGVVPYGGYGAVGGYYRRW
jgi:hypothetical protein